MDTLHVELGERSYPIHIGRDLAPALLDAALDGRSALALVDENVAALQAARLDALLGARPRLILTAGEASKSLDEVARLGTALLDHGLGRDGALVTVGGGVCGDLGGFLAASYQRGIPFVQVPTTLLAQVDASVGGKVAVNLPGAKNSLGFFHQPLAVLADLAFLETLPRREMAAGLAELAKMGASLDPALLNDLESAGGALLSADSPDLPAVIRRACELKAAVVAEDERESGRREILNFGHTLAHALEGSDPKPDLLHGEAVGIGMLAALRLGAAAGTRREAGEGRLAALLAAWGLPLRPGPGIEAGELLAVMARDKKRRSGRDRFVLLEDWGRAQPGIELDPDLVAEVLESFLNESAPS